MFGRGPHREELRSPVNSQRYLPVSDAVEPYHLGCHIITDLESGLPSQAHASSCPTEIIRDSTCLSLFKATKFCSNL